MTPQEQETFANSLAAELWPSNNPPPAGETVRLAIRAAAARCFRRTDSLDAHPLAPVLREVLGLDVASFATDTIEGTGDAYCEIRRLCESREGEENVARRDLARIAAVALAGIEACDAAARGEGPRR